ncbi:MAG: DUF1566 domain-containing protein [Desulfuromonadaceae bacterium]|nr:DUF1566 domain-containing protein [Desulfuromonadaceae bacterium]MDD2856853.1 DUF1566 domain-containing protein [Desulfuromonadaceae bacterium]
MKQIVTSLAAIIILSSSSIAFSAPAPVPQTGQDKCYFSDGTEIPCPGTGQDGELKPGQKLPAVRFTDNTDETMTDNMTGLVWAKDMMTPGPSATSCSKTGTFVSWQESLDHVKCLNQYRYLNFNDWRLPTADELASVVNYGVADQHAWLTTVGFTIPAMSGSNGIYYYWSSNTQADNTPSAFVLSKSDGNILSSSKNCSFFGNNCNLTLCSYVDGYGNQRSSTNGNDCGVGGCSGYSYPAVFTKCSFSLAWPVRGNL